MNEWPWLFSPKFDAECFEFLEALNRFFRGVALYITNCEIDKIPQQAFISQCLYFGRFWSCWLFRGSKETKEVWIMLRKKSETRKRSAKRYLRQFRWRLTKTNKLVHSSIVLSQIIKKKISLNSFIIWINNFQNSQNWAWFIHVSSNRPKCLFHFSSQLDS